LNRIHVVQLLFAHYVVDVVVVALLLLLLFGVVCVPTCVHLRVCTCGNVSKIIRQTSRYCQWCCFSLLVPLIHVKILNQ